MYLFPSAKNAMMTTTMTVAVSAAMLLAFLSSETVVLVNAQENNNNDTGVNVGIGGVSDITVVSIGDTFCVEGYVMDHYCIDIGSLLDRPNIRTLEGPEQHSIHCLVDVGPCLNAQLNV